jgi:hypothetical protein
MTRCNECQSIEPKIVEMEIDGETLEICGECLCEEDTLEHYDEDYGSDR